MPSENGGNPIIRCINVLEKKEEKRGTKAVIGKYATVIHISWTRRVFGVL